MSQTTPKNKEAGKTKSQESLPNKNDSNEESKEPSQNQEKKKGWSFNSWFKKPKASPSNDTTKDDSTQSTEEEIMKSKPKNLEKFGNYAKSLLKGIANNVQTSLMEPAALGDPMWGDFQNPVAVQQRQEEEKNQDQDDDEEYDDEDEEEQDDEENGDEEGDEEDEESEEDEEKGYEESEGSLEDEQEKETPKEPNQSNDDHFDIGDDFAIDDDEPEPIRHSNPSSQEELGEEKKAGIVTAEQVKTKKKKGKGKKKSTKDKAKRKKRREPKTSEGVILEDVFVNKRYVNDAPFTNFHQLYFKGDYLDFDPDEFYQVELVNEKGGLTNFIFTEKKYISIQDNIFYFMKHEKLDTYDLGLVLESYPLSRLVRLDKIEKKKRIDLSFYVEDSVGNPNQQREFVLEVKNYAKFVKNIDQTLSTINSSFHILRYNIE